MSWSKVEKGYKPLGWWYCKIMCEFGWLIRNKINTDKVYYYYLNKMCNKYRISLYGRRL